jgi:hypothetical protein
VDRNLGQRLGSLAGIVSVALLVVAFKGDSGDEPSDAHASLQAVARFMTAHAARQGSRYLAALSVFFFLWFVCALRAHLRRVEPDPGTISSVAFAGGLVTATLLLVGVVVWMSAGFYALRGGDARDATILYTLGLYPGLTSSLSTSVMLSAAAVLGFSARAIPRWLAVAGSVIAVGLLVGLMRPDEGSLAGIYGIAFLLSEAWIVVASVVCFRGATPAGDVTVASAPVANAKPGRKTTV